MKRTYTSKLLNNARRTYVRHGRSRALRQVPLSHLSKILTTESVWHGLKPSSSQLFTAQSSPSFESLPDLFEVKVGTLNRLRKNSGPDRKDVPQGLKPDVFSFMCGPTKVVP